MAVTENIEVQIASVIVDDEYRVELTQIRRRTSYTPHQAEQLADDLWAGAVAARAMLRDHIDLDRLRTIAQPIAEGI